MARFNEKQKTQTERTRTRNEAGGEAFEPEDGRLKLYKVASNNLVEGKFYTDTEQSLEKVRQAFQEAVEEEPAFPVKLAGHIRQEMGLRTISQYLLVLASQDDEAKQYITDHATEIMARADEPAEVVAIHEELYGEHKTLPQPLKKAIEMAYNQFDEYELQKYDKPSRKVRHRDVLNRVHPVNYDEKHDELFGKIAKGELEDYPEVDELETAETWEVVVSQKVKEATPQEWMDAKSKAKQKVADESFLSEQAKAEAVLKEREEITGYSREEIREMKNEAKKKAFEQLLEKNKMGMFAKIRNLRNMLQVGIEPREILDDDDLDYVKNGDHKMLPFRFYQAYLEVKKEFEENYPYLEEWLSDAVDGTAQNLAEIIPGTFTAVDISASMESQLSRHSTMQYIDISELFGAVLYRNGSRVGAFADDFEMLEAHYDTPTFELMEKLDGLTPSGSTNAWKVIRYLKENEITDVERVVMLTDGQFWDDTRGWGDNAEKTVKQYWEEYREMNPDASLYMIDLSSYGDLNLPEGFPEVYRISGWDERLIDFIEHAENPMEEIEKISQREPVEPEVTP